MPFINHGLLFVPKELSEQIDVERYLVAGTHLALGGHLICLGITEWSDKELPKGFEYIPVVEKRSSSREQMVELLLSPFNRMLIQNKLRSKIDPDCAPIGEVITYDEISRSISFLWTQKLPERFEFILSSLVLDLKKSWGGTL